MEITVRVKVSIIQFGTMVEFRAFFVAQTVWTTVHIIIPSDLVQPLPTKLRKTRFFYLAVYFG